MTLKECYAILGVAKTAKLEDVKRAYRRRAFELHPDLNPNLLDASRQFQLLNEAYVNLSRVLSAKEDAAAKQDKKQAGRKRPAQPGRAAGTDQEAAAGASGPQPEKQAGEQAADATQSGPADAPGGRDADDHKARAAAGDQDQAEDRKRRAAEEAYLRQDEVLRDILNDPFARRVFEDIYSEINKQSSRTEKPEPEPEPDLKPASQHDTAAPPKARKLHLEWGGKRVNLDLTNGFSGAVRTWLRRQIDDELTVHLPRARLFPGARVRLQIRQGLKQDLKVVEITLPQDFKTGKPIRLKGLGKQVGKWTGDLYLTIEPQQ